MVYCGARVLLGFRGEALGFRDLGLGFDATVQGLAGGGSQEAYLDTHRNCRTIGTHITNF